MTGARPPTHLTWLALSPRSTSLKFCKTWLSALKFQKIHSQTWSKCSQKFQLSTQMQMVYSRRNLVACSAQALMQSNRSTWNSPCLTRAAQMLYSTCWCWTLTSSWSLTVKMQPQILLASKLDQLKDKLLKRQLWLKRTLMPKWSLTICAFSQLT